ncbi:hypothetical protein Tco_0666446 [Tanacetum coccineum]
MLRHRLTVPPSYCRDVVVAECIASAPIACTARQMVFSSPWLTAKKESGSPLQTALVCYQKLDGIHFPCSCWDEKWLVQEGTALELASPEQPATGKDMSNPLYGCDGLPITVKIYLCCCKDWKLLFFDVATSFDSAVHQVHVVSFDAAVLDVAAQVSAACIVVAGYIASAGICDAAGSFVLDVFIYICWLLCFCCSSILLLREDLSRNLELTESKPSLGGDLLGIIGKMTKGCLCMFGLFVSAEGIKSFLLIMFLLVMFSFLLTEIESADLMYRRD